MSYSVLPHVRLGFYVQTSIYPEFITAGPSIMDRSNSDAAPGAWGFSKRLSCLEFKVIGSHPAWGRSWLNSFQDRIVVILSKLIHSVVTKEFIF